jgi:transposase
MFGLVRVVGVVRGLLNQRCHKDYMQFLMKADRNIAGGKVLHIVADNVSPHKTKDVQAYLDSKPGRFVIHYIPAHSSWLNMVERWFAEITNKRIQRESWESTAQLTKAVKDYIKTWNKSGRHFMWTKTSDEILIKIHKAIS